MIILNREIKILISNLVTQFMLVVMELYQQGILFTQLGISILFFTFEYKYLCELIY